MKTILYTGLFCGGCEPYAYIDRWKIICLNNLLKYSEAIGADFRVYGNENKPFWKFFDALESFGYNGWLAATMIKNYVIKEFIQTDYDMMIWSDLDIIVRENNIVSGPNQFNINTDPYFSNEIERRIVFESSYGYRDKYHVLNSGFFSMDKDFALRYLEFIHYNDLEFYKRVKQIEIKEHFPSQEALMEIFLNNNIDRIRPMNNPFGFDHYVSHKKSEIR